MREFSFILLQKDQLDDLVKAVGQLLDNLQDLPL